MKDLPAGGEPRVQVFHIWQNWMNWAVSFREKRRALAQLGVSEEITPVTRAAAHKTMTGIAELLERSRANGPMRKALLSTPFNRLPRSHTLLKLEIVNSDGCRVSRSS